MVGLKKTSNLQFTTAIFLILLLSTTVYAQAEEPAPETTIEPTTSTETTAEPTTTLESTDEEPTGGGGDAPRAGEAMDPYTKYGSVSQERSPLADTGAFQTNLFTGAATYTYSIEVPPGTNGLAPSLSLTYNSHSARGRASWVGLGWEISPYYIQRNVNYTPNGTSDDEFNLVLNSNSYELIYNSTEGRYHTKTESYLYIKNQSGATNENGTYWLVRTKDGTEYRFGYNNDSETLSSKRDHVWRWSLDKVNDTHNNSIYYNYLENPNADDNGTVYLNKIEYNNDRQRIIYFDIESRTDKYCVYDQGSKVCLAGRLKNINVTANGSLVRRYSLDYTYNNATSKSLLSSITEYGSDSSSSLPATNFSYYYGEFGFDSSESWSSPDSNDYLYDSSSSDGDVIAMVFDINGDGLPEYVKKDTGHWDVYPNTGDGFESNEIEWNTPGAGSYYIKNVDGGTPYTIDADTVDINGDGLPDLVIAGGRPWSVYLNNGTDFNETAINWGVCSDCAYMREIESGGDVYQDTLDLNGDGLPDYVVADSYGSVGNYYWKVYLNNGTGIESDNIEWSAPDGYEDDIRDVNSSGDITRDVLDINGDGLPDLVVKLSGDDWGVYFNNGDGFDLDKFDWDNYDDKLSIRVFDNDDTISDTLDINGDGLPDYVEKDDGNEEWDIYLNEGDEFDNNGEDWDTQNDNWDIRNVDTGDIKYGAIDLDGDGLIDYVDAYSAWYIYPNKLYAPDLLSSISASLGGTINITYAPSTTFNNSGSDNIYDLPHKYWIVNATITDNGITGIHNLNSTTTYSYANGSYDSEDGEFRGFGYVRVTDPHNTTIEHRFNQSDALKGKEYLTVIKDNTSNLYAKTNNTWNFTQSGEIYIPTLDQVDEYIYDGSASNPNITITEYEYDDYGNVDRVSFLGSPDISGDEKYLDTLYCYNATKWIVDKVKMSTLKAADDSTKMSESYYAYDGRNYGTNPALGDLTKEQHWLDTGSDPEIEYGYDSYGNLINTTDAEGHTTNYTYGITDGTYTFPEQVVNALGQAYNYSYYLSTGNLNWSKDPNDYNATYEYDVFGRIIKEIQPYDSSSYPTVTYNYSRDGSAPEMVNVSRRNSTGQTDTLDILTFVDGFGKVIQIKTDAEDTSKQIIANTYYDKLGRVESQSVPYLDTKSNTYSTPSSAKNTNFTYDCLGRNTQTTNTDGTTRNQSYDHLKLKIVDENGHTRTFFLDAHNRIIQVQENNSGSLYNTTYGYNARDELINITDNEGNIFNFSYDSLGRKTNISDPDMGGWNYSYDKLGNLLNQTDARGTTTKFEYDSLNRITKIDYQTDTDVTYDYGLETIGTLGQINDSVGMSHYYYDQRLRIISENRTADGRFWTTNWSYDSMDRVISQIYPSGQKINFTYNAQGELDSIPNFIDDIDYNALGKITDKDFSNGALTAITYHDDDFRLNRILTSAGATIFQNRFHHYDDTGNIILIEDYSNSSDLRNYTFTYDALDRIFTASESGGGYSRTYTYNSIGNILTANKSGTVQNYTYGVGSAGPHALTNYTDTTTSCGCTGSQPPSSGDWDIDEDTSCSGSDIDISGGLNINNGHALTLGDGILYLDDDILMDGDLTLDSGSNIDLGGSGGSCSSSGATYNLTYDENGNLIEGFGFTFAYDNANRLANVSNSSGLVAEYFYDSNGQRFKKNESGTVTYYVGEHFEAVSHTNDTVINTSYYFANGERMAKASQGSTYYFHPDHLGSTNVISNSSGTIVETTKYYPFGKLREGGDSAKHLFTGQEFDTETGLYYYGARYYSPDLMRFAQPDPVIQDLYNPQSLNHYSYVRNNPVKYVDPSGNFAVSVAALYLATVGTLGGVGYLGGVAVGWAEYRYLEHKEGTPYDYEREKELIRQRSSEGAGVGFVLAGAGIISHQLGLIDLYSIYGLENPSASSSVAQLSAEQILTQYNDPGANPTAGKTVLGSGPQYIKKAQEMNANYLKVPDQIYDTLEESGKFWEVNKQFLDKAIERGDEIVFATNPYNPGANFQKELDYLINLGFEITEKGAKYPT